MCDKNPIPENLLKIVNVTAQQLVRVNDVHAREMDYLAQTFVEVAKKKAVKIRIISHMMRSLMMKVSAIINSNRRNDAEFLL